MQTGGKIVWTPEMSVGVDALDHDHKILVNCLNDFIDACENEDGIFVTDAIFAALLEYAGYHFTREEKIMELCGFPGLENHKELHKTLAEKVVDNRQRFIMHPSGMLQDEVKEFLQTWLQEHILGSDMAYASSCVGKEKEISRFLEQENSA